MRRHKTAAGPKAAQREATRFILCDSGNGLWLISEKRGRITGISAIDPAAAREVAATASLQFAAKSPRPRKRERIP